MDNEQKDEGSELELSKIPQEDEVRASVINDYGFNEVEDAERIDKLVVHIMDQNKRLSSAIGQKIKQRQEKEELMRRVQNPDIPREEGFTTRDIIALAKSGIEIDDIDEVENYAKYRKITASEALHDSTLKAIIAKRLEDRKTANATQTGGPRVASRITGETLLEQASRDRIPEKDEDSEKLVEARMARAKKGS